MNYQYICTECGAREDVTTMDFTCSCGGLWDLDYQAEGLSRQGLYEDEWSIFKYSEYMPLLDRSWKMVSMGEGLSPIISWQPGLALKMDYLMPTLSFKDRGAAVVISHAKTLGVDRVIQDSSGNAGAAIAAYASRANIKCRILVPEGTSRKKIDMIRYYGGFVAVIKGDRDKTARVCRDQAREEGIYYASHVYNPYFYQGTKTYIYEVYDQLGRMPASLIVPIGNGSLFLGVIKGLEELKASGLIQGFPRILAYQAEGCAPIYLAHRLGRKEPGQVQAQETLAEGIAVAQPMRGRQILKAIRDYGVDLVTVDDEAIQRARIDLMTRGIYVEPTAAAGLAAYRTYEEKNGPLEDCIIPMTGAGLKGPDIE